MKLAIFSPSQNPYSETFIQAHKNYINAEKLYYIYGSNLETMCIEDKGVLIPAKKKILLKGYLKITKKNKQKTFEKIVAKKLLSLEIDVALVEYGNNAMKLLKVFEFANIPFVVHFHGYDISVKKTIEQNNNYSSLFESASFVIGVSKLMCNRLEKIGCPKEKIKYNVYGAEPIFEKINPLFKEKQFLSIGRFVDKKAPYYTILAFSKVVKSFPNAKLTMVGDGILLNTCQNFVRYLKLENSINLVGVLPPNQIREFMENSYAFVQHSVTASDGNQEGTPVAVMEAAIAGLPVISTYHAGIPDVIEHEISGLLSEEHEVEEMAINMLRILKDKNFAMRLGEKAKKIHKEKYSLDRHIKSIESLLKESIKNKKL